MEVTGLSADTFWKGETEIRGEVTDGTERYRVRILRKGSQIFDYSCSRVDKNGKRTGYCSMEKEETQSSAPMERLYMERI